MTLLMTPRILGHDQRTQLVDYPCMTLTFNVFAGVGRSRYAASASLGLLEASSA
jgi:hypothetical protein